MENPKNQLAAKLKDANNVLVTVSTNPTVDQLSAAIGLTLFLTKLKKHSTTVFSGQIPSTIDFLKPEETIENNTDSLRDFIISLDKNKADKIRYKVEDQMVKIFVTPYRTSIGEQDLVFSQGDFNVDVVIGLGIHNREDLDQAITSHGRILHDATVATVNTKDGSDIGTLNWVDQQASSLCEMALAITDMVKTNSLDEQISTAFLTGIVAETERFSNDKTTSNTMNASAKLMAAGANQQLVATKLEPPEELPPSPADTPKDPEDSGDSSSDINIDEDGSLRIDHDASAAPSGDQPSPAQPPSDTLPPPVAPEDIEPEPVSQVQIDENGQLQTEEPKIKQDHRQFLGKTNPDDNPGDMFGLPSGDDGKDGENGSADTKLVTEPPKFGGQLSAAADDSSSSSSPLNLPSTNTPILNHDTGSSAKDEKDKNQAPPAAPPPTTPPPSSPPPSPPKMTGNAYVDMGNNTLDSIEDKLKSKEENIDSKQEEPDKPQGKLPEPFVKSLDGSTLTGLEQKIGSPHLKTEDVTAKDPQDYHDLAAQQVAKAVSGKTLNEIEEKVESPHLKASATDKPAVISQATNSDTGPKMDYEPHESEPPDTTATSDKGIAEDNTDDSTSVQSVGTSSTDNKPAQDDTKSADDVSADDSADDTKADITAADDNSGKERDDVGAGAARDAVMQAINTGGDGRTSLPALESIGAQGAMPVGHDDSQSTNSANTTAPAPPETPPPLPSSSQHQEPSPNIHIDDSGNLSFPKNLVPSSNELPKDATASTSEESSAPPVPPPMMPPVPEPSENSTS